MPRYEDLSVTNLRSVGGTRIVRTINQEGAPTSDATAGARTYTAAEILGGTIIRDPNGAARTDVLPTAALLVAGMKLFPLGAEVGDIVSCLISNTSDGAIDTEQVTLSAGTGGAFDANQAAAARLIRTNTARLVRIRITNVTSGSEAYVVYC